MLEDVWDKPVPPIKDPCVRRCGVSSSLGFCRGCFMTLKEISDWHSGTLSEGEQREVLENIEARKKKYHESNPG
jgi:predicted Fe-S protein YdhL (DUF1289 family)